FGFDRMLLMVSLYTEGPAAVDAPVVLKAGEKAHVCVPCRLARHRTRTRYVGGSQSVSVPIFRGVRYRVGGFAGQPVQQEYIAVVDTGQLVLTTSRVVFVGSAKLVEIPLAKVSHVGAYTDALEI